MGLIANYREDYDPEKANRDPFLDDREKFLINGYFTIGNLTPLTLADFPGRTLYIKKIQIIVNTGGPKQFNFIDESNTIEVFENVVNPDTQIKSYSNEDEELQANGNLRVFIDEAPQSIYLQIIGYLRN